MTLLEKIIYIADYIEPHRYKAPELPAVRRLAFEDLDLCLFRIMDSTVKYLQSVQPEATDPTTAEAREYYFAIINKKKPYSSK